MDLRVGDRFVERMRKSLEVRARETCECCKQDVTSHSSRKQNSQNAERNADSGTLDHELSEKNKEWAIHVRFWKRTQFPSCPKNLKEARFKTKDSFG